MTSKLQVTVPKAIATRYGIRPGDEIEWVPAGRQARTADPEWRLKLFDAATERQRLRQSGRPRRRARGGRGWTREDLYDRARPR